MVKAFSELERISVRDSLLAEGRALFIQHGLAGMSLARMTQAAGVAKTSFYLFFASKEELLLDLLAAEAPRFSDRVMAALRDPEKSTADALKAFLHALLQEYQNNPFLARLIAEPQTMEVIASRVRAEDLLSKTAWMERPLTTFLAERLAAEDIALRPAAQVLDVLRAVALLVLHRDRFSPPQRFAALSSAMIDLIVDGLMRKDG